LQHCRKNSNFIPPFTELFQYFSGQPIHGCKPLTTSSTTQKPMVHLIPGETETQSVDPATLRLPLESVYNMPGSISNRGVRLLMLIIVV
jgi:hypothetical protein